MNSDEIHFDLLRRLEKKASVFAKRAFKRNGC